MSGFHKKSAGIIASVLISVMILGFIFSGYYGGGKLAGVSDAVASVDGTPIRQREFEINLRQQVAFFQSMMGGREITPQMLEQFGIKQQVLSNLVSQKILLNFGEKLGINAGAQEIKERVEKELAQVFKERPFSVETYKEILRANGFTPQEFEKMMSEEIRLQQTLQLVKSLPISRAYAAEIATIKQNELEVEVIQLDKGQLERFVPVSEQEIETFLKKEESLKKVTNYFNSKKASLNKPEKVKVHHILVKDEEKAREIKKGLTVQNFAEEAIKHSEDPSVKKNQGNLGFIARGQMVPDFEDEAFKLSKGQISEPFKTEYGYHIVYVEEKDPAKEAVFEEFKNALAKEMIQKEKLQDLQKLQDSLALNLKGSMEKGDEGALENLHKEYQFTWEKKTSLNPLSNQVANITVTPEMSEKLFAETPSENYKVFQFNEITKVVLIKSHKKHEAAATNLDQEFTELKHQGAKEFEEELMKSLRDKSHIKVYKDLM